MCNFYLWLSTHVPALWFVHTAYQVSMLAWLLTLHVYTHTELTLCCSVPITTSTLIDVLVPSSYLAALYSCMRTRIPYSTAVLGAHHHVHLHK